MTEKIFADGLRISVTETQYGEIIKLGFEKEKFIEFLLKYVNHSGYVNVDILTNKEGKKYAVLNTYKKPEEHNTEFVDKITNAEDIDVEIGEDEIPFN